MPTSVHRRVEASKKGEYPFAIGRLEASWVVVHESQPVPGYCLILSDPVVPSLNEMDEPTRAAYLRDMAHVGDALLKVTDSHRINYETWANLDPALHTHIVPRYMSEPEEKRVKPVVVAYAGEEPPKFDPVKQNDFIRKMREALKPYLTVSILTAMLIGTSACSSGPKEGGTGSSQVVVNESNLTQDEAQERARLVSSVDYKLAMDISKPDENFSGDVTIKFNLALAKMKKEVLAIDFKSGGDVLALQVNGKKSTGFAYQAGKIAIARAELKEGANEVTIAYSQKYSTDGSGLYRYKDPEDGRVYLYTQFEAYYANYMFPCFDQPDLKAKMVFTVRAPDSWQVISTTEAKVKKEKDMRIWEFAQTPLISTYLYSLHAGPYAVWTSKAGATPLRLFARQSLKKYVNAEEWFVTTRAGLKFFEKYFEYPYPFKKYDQVIVPDFNAGAMENVAAVTFSENFISRGKKTELEKEDLANVILHEMAHMWFGNLVTMKWWNGLWLNESFASYMASLAQAEATPFKQAWISFHDEMKGWAYWEDQLVTTHPIDVPVLDTHSAFNLFDGITYGKGAASLQQLSYFIGPEAFRKGVASYFKKFHFSNTRLADFINELSASSGKDLSSWSQKWLLTSGHDTIGAEFTCSGEKIDSFKVVISNPVSASEQRPHRTNIGLYKKLKGKIALSETLPVDLTQGSTTVPQLLGKDCPAMVFPNEGDKDFAKARLDARTITAVASDLKNIEDRFTRFQYWSTLFQMVRDGLLMPSEFVKIAEANLPSEGDLKLVQRNIEKAVGPNSALYYMPESSEADKAAKLEVIRRFETITWNRLKNAQPGSDLQDRSLVEFIRTVRTQESANILVRVLEGQSGLRSMSLDQDKRWAIVSKLSSIGDKRAANLLMKEKARDKSERGVQMALATEAAAPSSELKAKWLEQIVNDKQMSFARKDAVLDALFPNWQDTLLVEQSPRIFSLVLKLIQDDDQQELASSFVSRTMPLNCTQSSTDRVNDFFQKHQAAMKPSVIKSFRVGLQENNRCVKLRAAAI